MKSWVWNCPSTSAIGPGRNRWRCSQASSTWKWRNECCENPRPCIRLGLSSERASHYAYHHALTIARATSERAIAVARLPTCSWTFLNGVASHSAKRTPTRSDALSTSGFGLITAGMFGKLQRFRVRTSFRPIRLFETRASFIFTAPISGKRARMRTRGCPLDVVQIASNRLSKVALFWTLSCVAGA